MMSSSSSSTFIRTGLSLVLLQLLSRLLTFSLNQALLRFTSPEALGTASIQLEVLLNTVLFLSRENVRGALSRLQLEFSTFRGSNLSTRYQQIVNCCFVPLPTGFVLSTLLFTIYVLSVGESTSTQAHFKLSLFIYYLSSLCELASEPAYLYHLLSAQTSDRVKVEGKAVLLKTVTTLSIIVFGSRTGKDWALLGFSIGQLVYGTSLAIGLWHNQNKTQKVSTKQIGFGPKWSLTQPDSDTKSQTSSSNCDTNLKEDEHLEDHPLGRTNFTLICALTRQSVLKQFLTEGDKMLIGRICPIAHQGAYALALNYGSLVARIVFQPIEETSRLYFSKTLGTTAIATEKEPKEQHAFATLTSLILFQSYIGLLLISFGPWFVKVALLVVLGPNSAYLEHSGKGTSVVVVDILRAYCGLLPLLALNGVLEAFVQSVANEKELGKMSKMMVVWCAVFGGSVWLMSVSDIGSEVGMVLCTCINMACRIGYCWKFVLFYQHSRKVKTLSLAEVLPHPVVSLAFLMSAWIVRRSESGSAGFRVKIEPEGRWEMVWAAVGAHLSIGVVSFVTCAGIAALIERGRVRRLFQVLRSKRD
ncbi:Rft protein-domain-containing protein [Melampsora americana]|nr:Rft protein-domain-containing protein [Melampsora americana]